MSESGQTRRFRHVRATSALPPIATINRFGAIIGSRAPPAAGHQRAPRRRDDPAPGHSTFSVNRHGRFRDSDILRHVFEGVVRACMDAGLVKGEGFAIDASVTQADASRYHGKAPDEIDWSVPERQTRAVAEFLTALDDNPEADRKLPKVISPVDPCSAWTAKVNKRVQFGYGLNYLIDIDNALIVDVEATPARTYDEVAATKTMITRTEERLGLKPDRLAADTAYGTGKFLGWLMRVSAAALRLPSENAPSIRLSPNYLLPSYDI